MILVASVLVFKRPSPDKLIKFGPWAQDHREYEKSANNAMVPFSTY